MGTIQLEYKPKKKQNIFSKGLDIVSGIMSQPRTFFSGHPLKAAEKVRESREKIRAGDKGEAFKSIATTALTATALAAPLTAAGRAGALALGKKIVIPKTVGGAFVRLAAIPYIGTLSLSKEGRDVLTSVPEKVIDLGVNAAEEQIDEGKDTGQKKKVMDLILQYGLPLSLAGMSLVALRQYIKKMRDGQAPTLDDTPIVSNGAPSLTEPEPSTQLNNAVMPSASSGPQGFQTMTAAEPTTTKKKNGSKSRSTRNKGVNVSQRVNVVVTQNQNKRYLKKSYVKNSYGLK